MTQSGRVLVGERGLELVGAGGQAVAHDRLHPPLAEGAARLLVGEDVLQRDDFLGHAGDARLRGVDDGQPLVELAEIVAGGLRVAFEPGAEPRADVVEALRHHARDVAPAASQPFAHRAEAPGELGAGLRRARRCAPRVRAGAPSAAARFAPARRARARERDDESEQQQRDRRERAAERLAESQGMAVEDDEDRVHDAELSQIRRRECERKTNTFDRAAARDYQTMTKRDSEMDAMAAAPHHHPARSEAAPRQRAARAGRRRAAQADGRHDRDHVRRARHRPGGDPDRRADARRGDRSGQEGRAEAAAIFRQSRDRLVIGRDGAVYEEGCLSIPEYYEEVERPARCACAILDRDGKRAGDSRRGAAGDRAAARDRPSRRRAVHRLHLQAQARPGDEEIRQDGQAAAEGQRPL